MPLASLNNLHGFTPVIFIFCPVGFRSQGLQSYLEACYVPGGRGWGGIELKGSVPHCDEPLLAYTCAHHCCILNCPIAATVFSQEWLLEKPGIAPGECEANPIVVWALAKHHHLTSVTLPGTEPVQTLGSASELQPLLKPFSYV